MIIFDTETTGLVEPEAVPLAKQPRIIEFAAIKLGVEPGGFSTLDRMEFLCNPGIPLPPKIMEITGITDEMVANEKSFATYYPGLCDFFLGEKYLVAHNVNFDINLLRFELMRIGKLTAFPWPPVQICTIENSMHVENYRLNLAKAYAHYVGGTFKDAHRAMNDVEALTEIVLSMIDKGDICLEENNNGRMK